MTHLSLVADRDEGLRDPHRQALAAAIQAVQKAERAADASGKAVERATAMVEAARARLNDARGEVERARGATTACVAAAAASGETLPPDRSLRDARSRETDAADDLEVAKAALASVTAAHAEAEAALAKARGRVAKAADAVIKTSATAALLRNIAALQEQLIEQRLLLRFVCSKLNVEPCSNEGKAERALISTINRVLAAELPPPNEMASQQDWREHPASVRLAAAREALCREAMAPWPPP